RKGRHPRGRDFGNGPANERLLPGLADQTADCPAGRARPTITRSMAGSSTPAIVADGLAAAYADRLIWRDASFTVNTGEFVAVLGPNGSGKSTLLRLILRLLPPAAGSLQVLGKRPHRGNADVGYVPQRRNIDRDPPALGRAFV